MSAQQKDLLNKNYLIILLIVLVVVFLIANVMHQEKFPINDHQQMTDLLSIFGSFIVSIFGGLLSFKYKARGSHGVAWILFTLAMSCWFIAEYTYTYDYEYDLNNLSTLTSDIFFIAGYPLFLVFAIFYLKPRKNIITKKMILTSSFFSLLVVIPSLYYTFQTPDNISFLTLFLYAIYPILDGIILIPGIIGVFLFFRGKINLLWTMIFFGIILLVAGDTAYLIVSSDGSYYPGHPINILFAWSYLLFGFGAYSHLKLYYKQN